MLYDTSTVPARQSIGESFNRDVMIYDVLENIVV